MGFYVGREVGGSQSLNLGLRSTRVRLGPGSGFIASQRFRV